MKYIVFAIWYKVVLSMTLPGAKSIPKGFGNRVLVVGDGDMSFSQALSGLNICESVQATTLDSQERLFKFFSRSEKNVNSIIQNGDMVSYGVDATDIANNLETGSRFDTVVWNFPHIAGRQNIKRNRALLQAFFKSAKTVLAEGGLVKLSLCEGQSGTQATCKHDWNMSWKLTHQAGEAGLLVIDREELHFDLFPGYKQQGHGGHGGSFRTGSAAMYTLIIPQHQNPSPEGIKSTLQKRYTSSPYDKNEMVAMQAPLYMHELHFLADRILPDISISDLEERTALLIRDLLREKLGADCPKGRGVQMRTGSSNR